MKTHELQRLIHQLHVVIYAVVFIIISIVCVSFNLTTGNTIYDIAAIGLVAGLISYEIAYYFGNNKKKRK
jgi:heme O synthase-like polyprenyltransferase